MKIKRFIGGSCVANSYVLFSEASGKAVLIDSCGEVEKILEMTEKMNLSLEGILLTHGHFDHILSLSELKKRTSAKVYIYKDEEKFLSDVSLNLSNLDEGNSASYGVVNADVLLNDGDVIEFDDIKLEVIHTPGHTSGCVCYRIDDILFSGDTLFKKSIGRSDFPTGDYGMEIESIKKRLMCLDDDVRVYPGHGFSTTIGYERRENPYL